MQFSSSIIFLVFFSPLIIYPIRSLDFLLSIKIVDFTYTLSGFFTLSFFLIKLGIRSPVIPISMLSTCTLLFTFSFKLIDDSEDWLDTIMAKGIINVGNELTISYEQIYKYNTFFGIKVFQKEQGNFNNIFTPTLINSSFSTNKSRFMQTYALFLRIWELKPSQRKEGHSVEDSQTFSNPQNGTNILKPFAIFPKRENMEPSSSEFLHKMSNYFLQTLSKELFEMKQQRIIMFQKFSRLLIKQEKPKKLVMTKNLLNPFTNSQTHSIDKKLYEFFVLMTYVSGSTKDSFCLEFQVILFAVVFVVILVMFQICWVLLATIPLLLKEILAFEKYEELFSYKNQIWMLSTEGPTLIPLRGFDPEKHKVFEIVFVYGNSIFLCKNSPQDPKNAVENTVTEFQLAMRRELLKVYQVKSKEREQKELIRRLISIQFTELLPSAKTARYFEEIRAFGPFILKRPDCLRTSDRYHEPLNGKQTKKLVPVSYSQKFSQKITSDSILVRIQTKMSVILLMFFIEQNILQIQTSLMYIHTNSYQFIMDGKPTIKIMSKTQLINSLKLAASEKEIKIRTFKRLSIKKRGSTPLISTSISTQRKNNNHSITIRKLQPNNFLTSANNGLSIMSSKRFSQCQESIPKSQVKKEECVQKTQNQKMLLRNSDRIQKVIWNEPIDGYMPPVIISADFIMDQDLFWSEPRVTLPASLQKHWKQLHKKYYVIWVVKIQKGLKKIKQFCQTFQLPLNAIYYHRRQSKYTVDYYPLKKQLSKTYGILLNQIKAIQCLKFNLKNNYEESSFLGKVPIMFDSRMKVCFIRFEESGQGFQRLIDVCKQLAMPYREKLLELGSVQIFVENYFQRILEQKGSRQERLRMKTFIENIEAQIMDEQQAEGIVESYKRQLIDSLIRQKGRNFQHEGYSLHYFIGDIIKRNYDRLLKSAALRSKKKKQKGQWPKLPEKVQQKNFRERVGIAEKYFQYCF